MGEIPMSSEENGTAGSSEFFASLSNNSLGLHVEYTTLSA